MNERTAVSFSLADLAGPWPPPSAERRIAASGQTPTAPPISTDPAPTLDAADAYGERELRGARQGTRLRCRAVHPSHRLRRKPPRRADELRGTSSGPGGSQAHPRVRAAAHADGRWRRRQDEAGAPGGAREHASVPRRRLVRRARTGAG